MKQIAHTESFWSREPICTLTTIKAAGPFCQLSINAALFDHILKKSSKYA